MLPADNGSHKTTLGETVGDRELSKNIQGFPLYSTHNLRVGDIELHEVFRKHISQLDMTISLVNRSFGNRCRTSALDSCD